MADLDCHGEPKKPALPLPKARSDRIELFRSDNSAAGLTTETLAIHVDGRRFTGMVCYDERLGKRPLVMTVHNYQGIKQFDYDDAAWLARLGYIGLAVDCYGEPPICGGGFPGCQALFSDHGLFRDILAAWLLAGRAHRMVEPQQRAAAMGYCLGGTAVLEMLRDGQTIDVACSLHGLVQTDGLGGPTPKTRSNKHYKGAMVLIENGENDHFVTEAKRAAFIKEFRTEQGIRIEWHEHHAAGHGFALPDAPGYNEAADLNSRTALLMALVTAWPDVNQCGVNMSPCGTIMDVHHEHMHMHMGGA